MKFNIKDVKQAATAVIAALGVWASLKFAVDVNTLSAVIIAFAGGGVAHKSASK